MNYNIFASESVCAGHPDKICDQISDGILDAALTIDPYSRVAVETLVTTNQITIAGEVTCPEKIDYEGIARRIVAELGYTRKIYGFTDKAKIDVFIHHQSPDIARGVNTGGAGDQGMMFGYAVKETDQLMPLPIALAHALVKKMDELRQTKLKYLRPDGKSEVTVQYKEGKPIEIKNIVLAIPHDPRISKEQVREEVYKSGVIPVLHEFKLAKYPVEKLIVNGTGRWDIGGPASDTGVTGRKIIVDSYGGMARIGGGAFSGKDPTKVDRSAAYAARYIAKNIVAAGLADRCEIQLAYVIGYKEPITKAIETFGTTNESPEKIEKFAWNLMDLSTEGILKKLNLRRPIYRQTAAYGHFGNPTYSWEQIID